MLAVPVCTALPRARPKSLRIEQILRHVVQHAVYAVFTVFHQAANLLPCFQEIAFQLARFSALSLRHADDACVQNRAFARGQQPAVSASTIA